MLRTEWSFNSTHSLTNVLIEPKLFYIRYRRLNTWGPFNKSRLHNGVSSIITLRATFFPTAGKSRNRRKIVRRCGCH